MSDVQWTKTHEALYQAHRNAFRRLQRAERGRPIAEAKAPNIVERMKTRKKYNTKIAALRAECNDAWAKLTTWKELGQ